MDYCTTGSELFSDIVRIYPFEIGEIKYTVPFNVRKETVTFADLGITDIDELLKDRLCYSTSIVSDKDENPTSMDLDANATYEDSTEVSVAGVSHKVVLDFKVAEALERCIQALTDLELASSQDFILMTSDERFLLIRCSEHAYKCTVKRTTELKQVSIEIKNINGVQPVTE